MLSMFFKRTKKKPLQVKTDRLRVRPSVETLEDRLTPTVLTVGPSLSNGVEYTSIQAAINAAHSGDTIEVNSGTYTGQLTIGANLNNLTIVAENTSGWGWGWGCFFGGGQSPAQATIQAPATLTGNDAIIDISYSQNVTIQGFTINGNANTQFGVRVDDGANAVIQQNTVTNILAPDSSSIMIGRTYPGDVTTGTALVDNNTVSGYSKSGISVDSVGSYALICNNTVIGLGPQSTLLNYGIQISRGGIADVNNNNVSGNYNTGNSGVESAGILVLYGLDGPSTAPTNCNIFLADGNCFNPTFNYNAFNSFGFNDGLNDEFGNFQSCNDHDSRDYFYLPTSTNVENNNVFNNEDGIFLQETTNVKVIANSSYNNYDDGITVVDTNSSVIDNNCIQNNGRNGIGVYGGDAYTDSDGVNTFNVPTGGHLEIAYNTVTKSASDGFYFDYQFTVNTNGVQSQNAILQDVSTNNGGAGFNFISDDSDLVWQCTACSNQLNGYTFQSGLNYNNISAGSNSNLILQNLSQQNVGDGYSFTGASNNNLVLADEALHNRADGFYQSGSSNTYQDDTSSGNAVNYSPTIVDNPSANFSNIVVAWGIANGFNTSSWCFRFSVWGNSQFTCG